MDAVRELLAAGAFHEATVEEVAERAGVSRATLYQHFGSRAGLVDAICDTLADNPALQALRRAVDLDDPTEALDEFMTQAARFQASEEAVHRHLYGLAVIDSAAADFVERQSRDRRAEVERLARYLKRKGALRPGLSAGQAVTRLLILTSFGTYNELRLNAGMSPAKVESTLQELAREELLSA
jgi:AcrR family transcriptional regulator